jgi:two-component system chemotaxis sensor kinase CheA
MDIDMSQFAALFVEEAQEHLATLEAHLLKLQVDHCTAEELNEIFRAAHSIKGGSATFGLEKVTGVAHELESLLDLLRKGNLALTPEMVDASLKARDVIAQLIEEFEGKGVADGAAIVTVCEQLRALAQQKAAPAPEAAPAPAPPTIEGEGETFGFFEGAPAAPSANSAPIAPAAPPTRASGESSSIRVSVEKVDQIINLVGELVITQSMLSQMADDAESHLHDRLSASLAQLDRNTRDLQEAAMAIRMMPISAVFNRFPRVVRDLASKLGKQVELRLVGESTELDRGLIEKISDPLTHLVRNSLDHGIEPPKERLAAGKPAFGTVTLHACHLGGNIVIEVSDDGRGLNRERILAKARERGLNVPDNPHDDEVWNLIFEPGFSTAAEVTDVSGRGVGMDVVRSNIVALGGRVEIHSEAGRGTRMTVRLPLTLAILDGMSLSCGDEVFILPLNYIVESLRPSMDAVKTITGRGRVVHIRGEYLPVISLAAAMNIDSPIIEEHEGILVILETGQRRIALLVDALLGQHQVVIKSLEKNYRKVPGVSGATIMGDGRVALILDAPNLARMPNRACA